MGHSNSPIVIFTSIDGVVLNIDTLLFATAAKTLAQLARDGVAVVLCSGKTRAEIEYVQQKLGIRHPFICEHGAGVLIPSGYFRFDIPRARHRAGFATVDFGTDYAEVVETLHRVAERLDVDVVAFSDLSIEDVATYCHLPLLQARLAKLRDYEERFRVSDESAKGRSRLMKGLQAAGLRVTSGDTFDYAGAPVDARTGVKLLDGLYRRAYGGVLTAAVTRTSDDDGVRGFVDHSSAMSAGTAEAGIDVLDWTNAIVNAVEQLRSKPPVGRL